jgi:uncharacterized protein with PQ loop repeat
MGGNDERSTIGRCLFEEIKKCFFAIGITLWLIYGIALQSWPVIISNVVTLPLVLTVAFMKLRHG